MTDSVFVTYPIPDPGLPLLREHFEVRVFGAERAPTADEVVDNAGGCSGIVTLVRDRVDGALMDRLPGLKAVANYGVGYDNIDIPAATERGILVTNTPGVLTDATADLTWALMLAAARRVGEGERMMRAGEFHGWDPRMLLGGDVWGKTLGIVGFGRIGHAVARRARGFDMRVLFYDVVPQAVPDDITAEPVELERLLEESDFITLHVALTEQTRHLVDEAALRRMKPTAYLVNTSRGPVIDEAMLVRALREGWIAGAGLDVYEHEPQLAPGLAEVPNVVVLPHLGSATFGSRSGMAELAARNMIAALGGERPPTLVNADAWRGA